MSEENQPLSECITSYRGPLEMAMDARSLVSLQACRTNMKHHPVVLSVFYLNQVASKIYHQKSSSKNLPLPTALCLSFFALIWNMQSKGWCTLKVQQVFVCLARASLGLTGDFWSLWYRRATFLELQWISSANYHFLIEWSEWKKKVTTVFTRKPRF